MSKKKQFIVAKTNEIPVGSRKIVDCGGKSVGVFNVKGHYYALLNYCPHKGAGLCKGPITGTALPTEDFTYVYGYDEELIRCAWHGWEFEIASGQCLIDKKMRAKKYHVTVENGEDVVVHI